VQVGGDTFLLWIWTGAKNENKVWIAKGKKRRLQVGTGELVGTDIECTDVVTIACTREGYNRKHGAQYISATRPRWNKFIFQMG